MFAFEQPADSLEDAASKCRTRYYWYIYGLNDYTNFNFDYVPVPWESHYTHVWADQHQPNGNVYLTQNPAADLHYHADAVHRLGDPDCFSIPDYIDTATVDLRWSPDPASPPYIYHFPSQHQSASGVTYTVPGATDVKLVDAFVVCALPAPQKFEYNIAVAEFDYSWHPNPLDPPYDYVFGNQWNPAAIEPTVVYHVDGATECKYMDEIAQVAKDMTHWEILDDITGFDYSWRPDPTDPPYTYVFGNQWLTPEMRPALQYCVPGATQYKYIDEPKATRASTPSKFKINHDCKFDYSWEPDPGSPPYNYVFGNQWYPAEVMPTVEYSMPGATETKFMDIPARLLEQHDNHWHTLVDCKFDYSWQPNPGDPPFIYVFGNQWYPAEVMPTVEYHVPGATERKYMDINPAQLIANMYLWTIPEEIDSTNIDFTWCPHPKDAPYIHHFGSEYQISTGLMYTVPGATEPKFEGEPPKLQKEKTTITALDIFFIDKNNATAQTRFELLQQKYPKIQKVRYANNIMDTIRRCITRTKTNKFWVVSSEYDYSDFDFAWHAQPWQSYMTHVFPSQHQKWSDTFLINKWEFERHTKWAETLEQFPNLNFVTDQTVSKPENLHNIYYVDHGNPTSRHQYELLRLDHPDIVNTRFVDNYLDTFKRIMATTETEYVWIINSICDYTQFDFTWQPEPWQREMIHVFPSGNQRRGDTFYIHVESFKKQMIELDLLDWFNVINYCDDQRVDRFHAEMHYYDTDDLVAEIKQHDFKTPYVTFTNQKDLTLDITECLWTKKDRVVRRLTQSGATVAVPRDIKADLKTQIYDYPYISDIKPVVNEYYGDRRVSGLDIVYISNGEPDEERWYDHLCYMSNHQAKWVRGVNGRTAAYQEAARRSDKPWFFAVFAKLEVLGNEFPWYDWMPDYFQEPKHYIFNARNPVNGLEYGHMAMIAYNKKLVLENNTPGIDFTLSQPHESVPILSGVAHFNQSTITTWRTAFRETLKLKHSMETEPTLETEHRLDVWCNEHRLVVGAPFAQWSVRGALDAVEYYNKVNGNYTKLLYSFEWKWLNDYFEQKYGSIQNHP